MANWMCKNLRDALNNGEFAPVTGGITARADGLFLAAHPSAADHYQCPGCGHYRADFTLVDCRSIAGDALFGPLINAQAWMCDGCWTFMIFEAGKEPSMFEKTAADITAIGLSSTFRTRQSFVRDRARRLHVRSRHVDDLLDPLADAMAQTADLRAVDGLSISRAGGAPFSSAHARDCLLECKSTEGFLITRRSRQNMPLSLWLEMHNAPPSFVDQFRGKPKDFAP